MLRVYFDDELIDVEAYTELDNEYKLFTDTFKLGSAASNTFKLSVLKTAVNSQPYNVRIEDDDTVMNFVVDNVTEDDYVYAYTLTDKLLNFNFNYDASGIISLKEQEEEECYLSDIWKDMCNQANVEYDEDYVFENDIVVNWYDSRVQARRYLSYIAELQSGYAYITENGKQSFKKQNRSSVKTIDADECSDLIIGEKKTITRVVYDSGAFKWEYGDFEGNTLYLQSDNVFIVNEEIVENIYNNIKDFEFYILDVPNAPMDSSIKAGDVITIDDNGVMYPTIAQYTMSYAGGWTGGYKLSVSTNRQQETQVTKLADSIRNLKVNVNRIDNEFSIVAEEVEGQNSKITLIEQKADGIDATISKVDGLVEEITEIKAVSDEVLLNFRGKTKNPNLMNNSSGFFGLEGINGYPQQRWYYPEIPHDRRDIEDVQYLLGTYDAWGEDIAIFTLVKNGKEQWEIVGLADIETGEIYNWDTSISGEDLLGKNIYELLNKESISQKPSNWAMSTLNDEKYISKRKFLIDYKDVGAEFAEERKTTISFTPIEIPDNADKIYFSMDYKSILDLGGYEVSILQLSGDITKEFNNYKDVHDLVSYEIKRESFFISQEFEEVQTTKQLELNIEKECTHLLLMIGIYFSRYDYYSALPSSFKDKRHKHNDLFLENPLTYLFQYSDGIYKLETESYQKKDLTYFVSENIPDLPTQIELEDYDFSNVWLCTNDVLDENNDIIYEKNKVYGVKTEIDINYTSGSAPNEAEILITGWEELNISKDELESGIKKFFFFGYRPIIDPVVAEFQTRRMRGVLEFGDILFSTLNYAWAPAEGETAIDTNFRFNKDGLYIENNEEGYRREMSASKDISTNIQTGEKSWYLTPDGQWVNLLEAKEIRMGNFHIVEENNELNVYYRGGN